MNRKSLRDISWMVDEQIYRADSSLSYSTLSRYEREGYNNIDHLFDKVESSSLTFGSAVDSIITGGQEEFEERFMVAEFPTIPNSVEKIVRNLFNKFNDTYRTLVSIPDSEVIIEATTMDYQPNWKSETRAKVIKEKGLEYYNLLYVAGGRTVLNTTTYQDVCYAVKALKDSESTKFYFEPDNPFEPDIERLYQLKFKACLDNVWYRCMFDELIVDHKAKTIQPIDLKTSCKTGDREWDFPKHYIEWNYQIQNRLYVRILKNIIAQDNYFKDFEILPYRDIIIFRKSNTPLVWDIPFTFKYGTLYFGENNRFIMRDPEEIGKEVYYYISSRPAVPIGIEESIPNNIEDWLNKL